MISWPSLSKKIQTYHPPKDVELLGHSHTQMPCKLHGSVLMHFVDPAITNKAIETLSATLLSVAGSCPPSSLPGALCSAIDAKKWVIRPLLQFKDVLWHVCQ